MLEPRLLLASWTLVNAAPTTIGLMVLLSDGTVMGSGNYDDEVSSTNPAWYKLTPAVNGDYASGTWTTWDCRK